MTKDKLKDDVIRTICCLNSDISNKDRELLIKLFNSIIDYTNNTELEQELAQLQQKYNELVTNINKVEKLAKENNGDFTKYVNAAFDLSIFTSKEKVKAFLDLPTEALLVNDPLYVLSNDLITHLGKRSDELIKAQNDFGASFRLLVEGLRESKIGEIKYPDANSTLRLTFGKVRSLPADKRNDATINNYTTLAGQVKKYKKGDLEFDLPERVLQMNAAKDFGRYADKDGSLHVNFLTDNDITGGNSGSPVLNGKGELIGLAFDGNIEAMAGDVIFDKKLQRTINVDIRYVLWVIENFSGAKHIVDEMTIVK